MVSMNFNGTDFSTENAHFLVPNTDRFWPFFGTEFSMHYTLVGYIFSFNSITNKFEPSPDYIIDFQNIQ